MIVKFNSPAEFLEELKWLNNNVKVVRVARLERTSRVSPNITHWSIVATCRNGDEIIRLDRYCGDYWGNDDPNSEETRRHVKEVMATLEQGCDALGVEVRGGIYEHESGLEA